MKIPRTYRLDSEYKKEIAAILNGSLKDRDPSVRGIVSVTEVSVSPDLKNARVYLSVFDKSGEVMSRTFAAIRENAGFVRRELSRVMRMRTVPALEFFLDPSIEYGAKMDDLLSKIKKEDEARAAARTEEKDEGEDE